MRRWERWSLDRRVMVVSAAALTLAIILGIIAYALALDRILYADALTAARSQATEITAAIRSGDSDPAEAVQVPSQGSVLQVLDTSRTVIASSDPAGRDRPLTKDLPAPGAVRTAQVAGLPGELGEPYAVVAEGVKTPDGATYVVVVASPLRVEASSVRTATLLLVVGGGVLLTVLLLLIGRIVHRALEPVDRIRKEVDRITRVRDRERVTVPPSEDEIARLARTMNNMLDRLNRADANTRRFVSDASHELRSPLATIRAALEVSPSASDRERDELVLTETLRMQQLVDDLLTLASVDDHATLAQDDVDVDDIVDAEVRRVRGTTDIPVIAHIEAARVIGERPRLEQVVRNLVDNAVRHTTGAVGLSVRTEGDTVVLTVDNDGPPVPFAHRTVIFERFARLERSRSREHGGSGLGLSIARTLVEAHGGRISATETPDGNCRFAVRLPAAPALHPDHDDEPIDRTLS